MTLQSPRIQLHPFTMGDREELLAVFRDRDVRRFLLDDAIVSPEWVEDEIGASEARFAGGSAGLWSIRLVGQAGIIGFAGFREFFEPPELQLLYGLLPEFWKHGLATEAATMVCAFAFQRLRFSRVAAATDLPNVDSASVLRRLGMREVRRVAHGASGTLFFAIDRDTWLTSHRSTERFVRLLGIAVHRVR